MIEIAFWCVFAVLLVGLAVILAGYVLPIAEKLSKRQVKTGFTLDYTPCCPPGLGCNEIKVSSPCRRQLAYKLADAEETEQLDTYWSAYCRNSNAGTLGAWERFRDTLIEDKLHNMELLAQHKALLGASETIDVVQGTVEGKPQKEKNTQKTKEFNSFD